MGDLIAAVAAVARRHLPAEARAAAVDQDTDLAELGLDSVRVVGFMVDVERTFAVSFPDQLVDAATFRTPRAVAEAVRTLRGAG
ncbi:MAG: phosphopantetheine-binding protein [Mycobacteriales bacterium]